MRLIAGAVLLVASGVWQLTIVFGCDEATWEPLVYGLAILGAVFMILGLAFDCSWRLPNSRGKNDGG
jgi:uncharacterized membrane protein